MIDFFPCASSVGRTANIRQCVKVDPSLGNDTYQIIRLGFYIYGLSDFTS